MRYFRKIIIALFAVALAAILCGCQDVQWDYEAEEVPCTVMQFGSASVREEPAVIGGHHFPSNEIGAITEDGFTMLISSGRVFRVEDVDNPANGDFYGIEVEDIISTPEGKAWFPPEELLKEDSDGIVWVNWQYSSILMAPTSG